MTAESSNGAGAADMPEPVVKIDNQTDAFSTVVTVEFGDRLGELVDTVRGREGEAAGWADLYGGIESRTVQWGDFKEWRRE